MLTDSEVSEIQVRHGLVVVVVEILVPERIPGPRRTSKPGYLGKIIIVIITFTIIFLFIINK